MSAAAPSPVAASPSPVANSGRAVSPGTKLALCGIGAVAMLTAVFLPGGAREQREQAQPVAGQQPGEIGRPFQDWGAQSAAAGQQGAGKSGPDMPEAGKSAAGMDSVRLRRVAPTSIVGYQAPIQGAAATVAPAPAPVAARAPERDAARDAGNAAGGVGATGTVAGMRTLRAARLPQPQFWLMPGDKVPCLQVEPIVGIEGAQFTCEVHTDVKGRTGGVTLLDKGSRLVGSVVRGLDHGEERLGVVFSHAEGPADRGEDPIVVALDSPGADVTGRAGLDGRVDTHFWSKLGGVAAYALIDLASQGLSLGVGSAVGSALGGSRGGAPVGVFNFGSQGRSLAQSEFGQQANRRPTLERDRGEPLTVFIRHPIDFRDAVALRLRDQTVGWSDRSDAR